MAGSQNPSITHTGTCSTRTALAVGDFAGSLPTILLLTPRSPSSSSSQAVPLLRSSSSSFLQGAAPRLLSSLHIATALCTPSNTFPSTLYGRGTPNGHIQHKHIDEDRFEEHNPDHIGTSALYDRKGIYMSLHQSYFQALRYNNAKSHFSYCLYIVERVYNI